MLAYVQIHESSCVEQFGVSIPVYERIPLTLLVIVDQLPRFRSCAQNDPWKLVVSFPVSALVFRTDPRRLVICLYSHSFDPGVIPVVAVTSVVHSALALSGVSWSLMEIFDLRTRSSLYSFLLTRAVSCALYAVVPTLSSPSIGTNRLYESRTEF